MTEKKLHFSKLDSLRFIAFFLVIWQHVFGNSLPEFPENHTINTIIERLKYTGGIGVHIFFVISGFLITFLMIKEEESKGKLNIIYFYIRRFLRIWPLYYLIIILGIFILPYLFDTLRFEGHILKNLFFLNNFDMLKTNQNVGITWSVAIEEQFYLFWPLIFNILRNKKSLFIFSIILFFLSTIFIINNPSESYFHTFSNIRFLMTGCLGAIFYNYNNNMIHSSSIMNYKNISFAIVLIILISISIPFCKFIYYLSLLFLPLLYLFIVISLVIQGNDKKPSIISLLGKYTYGMYLYHPLIIIFFKILFDLGNLDYLNNSYINLLLAFSSLFFTILISYISYEYFEKIILKYKGRFSFVKTRI